MATEQFTLGIIGGGQLGKMLIQAAVNYDLSLAVLDPDPTAPRRTMVPYFMQGKLTDYDTVLQFGRKCKQVTIEIENVNTDALKQLEREGVTVYPEPDVISLIQDKRHQKQFYEKYQIPTSPFTTVQNAEELRGISFPKVQKLARVGYDGRGVQVLNNSSELSKAFNAPSVIENRVDIAKELSVIVARSVTGESCVYPVVELFFQSGQNILDYQLAPAALAPGQAEKAQKIALNVAEKMQITGLLAVEMFIDQSGEILVNEVAPRPHNSGHHTIEANYTSQYEQHLRAIMGWPLGDTGTRQLSGMVNLLGEDGFTGKVVYDGLDKVLEQPGLYVHLYGKADTRPFRKMGHITILADNEKQLRDKISYVKSNFQVIA